ncbi:hypothetical protein [Desulfovibrio legallii]|nr:hypothetical protein [Desulfovibrio legallii]
MSIFVKKRFVLVHIFGAYLCTERQERAKALPLKAFRALPASSLNKK